jgi:hypothetical protein
MPRAPIVCLAALLCLPFPAWGQAFKCTKSDGSVSYQDRPCGTGAQGAPIPLVAPPPIGTEVPGKTPGAPASRKPSEQDEVRRHNDEVRTRNAEVDAYNKQVRCNNARRDLSVLQQQRPVYRTDNTGKREYVEDRNRPAELAAAQARVAAECE